MATGKKPLPPQEAIPKSFKLYGKILNGYNKLGLLPLMWTGDQMRPSSTSSFVIWLAKTMTTTWCHIIFINIQCARNWFAAGPILGKLYFTVQALVYSASASGANYTILMSHSPLIAAMINNSLRVQRRYDEEGSKDKGRVPRLVFKVALFISTFAPLTFGTRILKFPNDPRSLVSLASNINEVAIYWRIICYIYQVYSALSMAATMWLTISTVAVFLRTVNGITKAIKKKGRKDLIEAISETTMLLIWFNSIFSTWTMVWEGSFISFVVIYLAVAVIEQSIRDLFVGGCIAIVMMSLYKSMGEIYEESKDIMKVAMPGARNSAWFQRKCWAYYAPRVRVGSFYLIDKGHVLTILSIVMQNTANLIIALREA